MNVRPARRRRTAAAGKSRAALSALSARETPRET